jgi:membrane protease YdiL (CAAX protease family)
MREAAPVRIRGAQSLWVSIGITVAFVVATVFLVAVPASRFTDPSARDCAAAVARAVLAFVAVLAVWRQRSATDILAPGDRRAWIIVLPVAVYSLLVYPPLFTGTWALNLSDTKLAAAVGLNGAAAGVLEELIFRGMILSLLLLSYSDRPQITMLWRAVRISALLFSAPHALNIFVGHAEARVLAQLVWSLLLGIVFACLRIVGRSIWPVAVLHGLLNAFVHVNRLGVDVNPSIVRAIGLALAPLPFMFIRCDAAAPTYKNITTCDERSGLTNRCS